VRIESNENSENAAVKITKSSDHEVNKDDSNDDDPALTLNRVVETEDGTVTEITRQSADQSCCNGKHISSGSLTVRKAGGE
jgi:hypothetical protein